MYKLSSNENPHTPLPGVLAACYDALADLNRYPDMASTLITEALAAHHGIEPEKIAPGTGSVAVLGHVLQAALRPGEEVVYAWRSFEAYPIAVQIAGGVSVRVPLTPQGEHDLEAMAEAIGPKTRAVILCSPNNPTGTVIGQAQLRQFLDTVSADVLVILDEAYIEFVTDSAVKSGLCRETGTSLLDEYKNLVVLRTFSKAYGLAGLRFGYAVARKRLAQGFRAVATPFGVNMVAEAAALESLRMREALMERVDAVVNERERVLAALRKQGWDIPRAHGNFFWLALGARSRRFATDAKQQGLLVRAFDGEGVRVSIGDPLPNDMLIKLCKRWKKELERYETEGY